MARTSNKGKGRGGIAGPAKGRWKKHLAAVKQLNRKMDLQRKTQK